MTRARKDRRRCEVPPYTGPEDGHCRKMATYMIDDGHARYLACGIHAKAIQEAVDFDLLLERLP